MLTYEDCLEFCDVSGGVVDAIAEHEAINPMQALAKTQQLLQERGGERQIRGMIIDDIRHAQTAGHQAHARELRRVFVDFIQTHPNHKPTACY